jgi:hypothetical protein
MQFSLFPTYFYLYLSPYTWCTEGVSISQVPHAPVMNLWSSQKFINPLDIYIYIFFWARDFPQASSTGAGVLRRQGWSQGSNPRQAVWPLPPLGNRATLSVLRWTYSITQECQRFARTKRKFIYLFSKHNRKEKLNLWCNIQRNI